MQTLLESAASYDILFIGGKGGVGKTTSSAAIAEQLAASGKHCLIVSTDPAHSLGDALNVKLSSKVQTLNAHLSALELNPKTIIDEHFRKVEETMRSYAKPDMMPALRKHLALAKISPGAEEAAMLEAICRLLVNFKKDGFDTLIFDTAPTGHTMRLMLLPEMMQAWTEGMLAQNSKQQKMRAAANALSDNKENAKSSNSDNRLQQATAALNERKALFQAAREMLHEGKNTGIFLVMVPEMLPLVETQRTHEQMREFHLPLAGIIVNQVMEPNQQDEFWRRRAERQRAVLEQIDKTLADCDRFYIPLLADDIRGRDALLAFKESTMHPADGSHHHHHH